MAKYKVTGEIQSQGPPALQDGLTAERVSSLPLEFETRYSGRRVEVKDASAMNGQGVYISIHNAPNTFLSKEETRRLGEALLEAAGDSPGDPARVTDNDGDDWVLQSDGTYTRVFGDGTPSSWDLGRSLEYIRETYGIRSEQS